MKNHFFVINSKGGSEKLKFVETDVPEPGFGEVLDRQVVSGKIVLVS